MSDTTAFFDGKTFDDFLFRPRKGVVSTRREISLRSRLTKSLFLELPVIPEPMKRQVESSPIQ